MLLVPMLDGDPWHITGYPDMGDLAYDPPEHEAVDHAIWQARDGLWHVLSCIRYTRVGRVLYEWVSDDLERPWWTPLGITMRADRRYGESINDWFGDEWIQAPHVIEHGGQYWMFYGGHNTELGECQICLATSADGKTWRCHRKNDGFSRVFVGPGDARDPMIIRAGNEWLCYYSSNDTGLRKPNKVYVRTSADLLNWSQYREVGWGGFISGTGPLSAQCPFVVHVDGYYYLFRTSEYYSPARTHVYRSTDPLDFGLNSDAKWVQTLRVSASEVVQVGDQWYISSVEDLRGGIQLFKLRWM